MLQLHFYITSEPYFEFGCPHLFHSNNAKSDLKIFDRHRTEDQFGIIRVLILMSLVQRGEKLSNEKVNRQTPIFHKTTQTALSNIISDENKICDYEPLWINKSPIKIQ